MTLKQLQDKHNKAMKDKTKGKKTRIMITKPKEKDIYLAYIADKKSETRRINYGDAGLSDGAKTKGKNSIKIRERK